MFTRKLFKSFIVISFLLLAISTSFAQEIELSPDAKMEFNRQKLSVEIFTDSGISSGTIIPGILKGYFHINNNTKWQAWDRLKKISNAEFLRITGYSEEGKKLQSIRELGKQRKIGGLFLTGFGVGLFLIADNNEDVNFFKVPGIISAWGGLTLIRKGHMNLTMSYFPSSTAARIADEYNHQLMINISKKF